MKTVTANFFRKHCARLLREVDKKNETVLITKRGQPIAKLEPIERTSDDIFGFFAGKGMIVGDVLSPLPPEDWGDLAWKDPEDQ